MVNFLQKELNIIITKLLTERALPMASAPLLRNEFQLRSRSVILSLPTFSNTKTRPYST